MLATNKYFQVGGLYTINGSPDFKDGTIVKVIVYSSTIDKTVLVKSLDVNAIGFLVAKELLTPYTPDLWSDHNTPTEFESKVVELLTTPDNHKMVVDTTLKGSKYEDRFDITRGFKYTLLTPKTMKDTDNLPVIIAHTDISKGVKTPTTGNLQYVQNTKMFYSPNGLGADDRAGCFVIGELIKNPDINAIYLLTDEEEVGCIGANHFCTTESFKTVEKVATCFISIDRRREFDGSSSIATYGYSSKKLEEIITTQTTRKVVQGSTTDCKVLSSKSGSKLNGITIGTACVNFSCGYQNEHSSNEKLYMDELLVTLKDITKVLTSGQLNDSKFTYSNEDKIYDYFGGYNNAYQSKKNIKQSKSARHLLEVEDTILFNGTFYDAFDIEKLTSFYKITTGSDYSTKAKIYEPTIDDTVTLKEGIHKGIYGGIKLSKEHIKLLKAEDFCVSFISQKNSTVDLVGLITKIEISNVPIAILQEITNYIEKGDFYENLPNN